MKTKTGSRVRKFLLAAMLVVGGSVASASVTKEFDWCSVTMPDDVVPGQAFEISVTLKPGIDTTGLQLANHLQWAKSKNEYGGFLSWHPARDASPGKTYTFRHNPKLDLDKMKGVQPIVFLAPGGDFAKRTKFETLPVMPVRATPEVIATLAEEAKRKAAHEAARARPDSATRRKSYIRILPNEAVVTKGDTFEMTVEYYLDASDHWGDGTKLELIPLGPWVDNPDGTYTTERKHHSYPGLGYKSVKIEPGKGTKTFSYTLGDTFRYNEIQWMARFTGGDGKAWPWSVRGGGPNIVRHVDAFDLVVPAEGGIFTYYETPRVNIVWGSTLTPGARVDIAYRLVNTAGKTVAAFTQRATVGAKGATTPVALPKITERGVLLLLATIGDTTRDTFFARIPDVLEKPSPTHSSNLRTPFGVTNTDTPLQARVARRLGATYCRLFTSWHTFEPLRGQWQFDALDARVKANVDAGIMPWICLVGPPAWVMTGAAHSAGYEPFSFDAAAWADSATTLAKRYASRGIWGFEWLNEILPGDKCEDPVAEYIDFCRIGTRAVRAVSPSLKVQLAGGLWPRNFRTDLLNAGVAESVDVLPIHYGGATAVREAARDVASVGKAGAVTIWDNETARGLSVWNMPPEENIVRSVMQSKWMMRQWPAELIAGAEAIVYFGGHTAAAGNWTYLLDASTPRPAAATFAVLSAKIGRAKPVATAYVGDDIVLHIFNGVVIASTISDADDAAAMLRIPTGATMAHVTDHQGNVQNVATKNGVLELQLSSMPVFIEGLVDLKTVAVHAGVEIGTQGAMPKPSLTVVAGSDAAAITLRAVNPMNRDIEGEIAVSLDGGIVFTPVKFALDAGSDKLIELPLAEVQLPVNASCVEGTVALKWTLPRASCEKKFTLTIIDSKSLGNLLKNGGMENAAGTKPASWSGDAQLADLATRGKGPGFEGRAARFSGAKSANYQHMSQSVTLPVPGRKYLYTAWVWNDAMQAGSNLAVDGKTFFIPSVFDAGNGSKFWKLMTHVRETPPDAKTMALTPVVKGTGWAMFDNVRVTMYEDTLYAAEARRAKTAPVIDGDLSDWDFADDPIPLLCENQLSAPSEYAWSPANLAGVARFVWDDEALYFAAKVRDDKHVANTTGEHALASDALVIALHPGNRAEGTDARAFAWYVSGAVPGGGSGKHTLYRPPAHSGGLASGQLAKDSSVYEISVKRTGDITTYEVRIPWSETGGLAPALGVKAGLSLQLFDTDGAGNMSPAVMTWGGGLRPAWSPSGFGVLTLTE